MSVRPLDVSGRKPGLDLLRLLAAALIFAQHSLSSCQLDAWIDVAGFRVGRIGTSLFFMLAGYLAASSSRTPLVWLRKRLMNLFPAYWVVTIAGFVIAAVTHFKSFDAWQIVCQLAGVGYFTHGERIVNVATWFMSPLLLMYVLATVIRLTRFSGTGLLIVLLSAGMAIVDGDHRGTVDCHAITFFVAFLISGRALSSQIRLAALACGLMALGTLVQPEMRYGGISMLLLAGSMQITAGMPLAERFTTVAYEWFLVHGLCVTMVARCTHQLWIVMPVAVCTSLMAATGLKYFVQGLRRGMWPQSGDGRSRNLNSAPRPVGTEDLVKVHN